MDVKLAASSNLGLEEVELDDEEFWRITIGFSRPWNRNVGSVLAAEFRTYKKFRKKDGHHYQ